LTIIIRMLKFFRHYRPGIIGQRHEKCRVETGSWRPGG